MKCYIYLFTAIGFPSHGSGRETCTNIGKRHLYTKWETVQKCRIHKKKICCACFT